MLDQTYWNNRYLKNDTGWDLGTVSPPLKVIFDQIRNKDSAILIPGCGNAHEAMYLAQNGFTNITLLDIAPLLVENLKQKFVNFPQIKLVCQDFFEHQLQYDYIIEQTFFCALPVAMRQDYATKMHTLLKPEGKIMGVLFNRNFDKEGPPFGGNTDEYDQLFSPLFNVKFWESTQSIPGRLGHEVCFEMSI